MNPDDSADYCRLRVAGPGANFYYANLYNSQETRRKLFCIHAFDRELGEIITECSDPGVARMKLAWWYEEIQRLYEKQPRHPVTIEIMHSITSLESIKNFFPQLIQHYEQQINLQQPETYVELMNVFRHGPGLLWRYFADICAYKNPMSRDLIGEFGCRLSYFQTMQTIPFNEQMNRYYWPRDEADNATSKEELYAFQIDRLINELDEFIKKLPTVDRKSQRYAIIMARIIRTTCKEIALSGYRLSEERISLTPFRKLWIAWRSH